MGRIWTGECHRGKIFYINRQVENLPDWTFSRFGTAFSRNGTRVTRDYRTFAATNEKDKHS